jgi:hypothetical protein
MMSTKNNNLSWILTASIIILLWGSIPTWAGHQLENQDLRFRGIYFDTQDYAVHIATMEAGRQGEWAYQFRFTTEPHRPAYIRLFYMALGHVSRWLRLPSESTYHLARLLLGMGALLALYRLMQQIFADRFWARTAFLLAAIGSGLGWLQLILDWSPGPITPIDFWLIDDYVFFSLSIFPHFAFVTAAICMALNWWLEFLEEPNWKKVALITSTAILVQFVNPIAFATIDVSFVGGTLFSWWRSRKIAMTDIAAISVIAIAQLPLVAYNFLVLSNDPLWSQFTTQNQTLSPPPIYYVWGFALFWIPALAGAIIAFRGKKNALGASIFWIVCGFALAYTPVYIQRRFLQNITIPLAILATVGLIRLFEIAATRSIAITRWRSSLVLLFIFLTSISSLQLGLSQIAYLQTRPTNLFYPASLDNAIRWFRENAHYNDFVLASEQTSQVLAQKAGLRAYMGHEMETLRYKDKMGEVEAFFQGELPELASRPIKWIVYGPLERQLGPEFDAPVNLELVYDSQDLQIYQVR